MSSVCAGQSAALGWAFTPCSVLLLLHKVGLSMRKFALQNC